MFLCSEPETQPCSGGSCRVHSLSASPGRRCSRENHPVTTHQFISPLSSLLFISPARHIKHCCVIVSLCVCRMVLASSLPSHLLSVLTPDPKFGLAPAIECAWCLHYLTCRWGREVSAVCCIDSVVVLCDYSTNSVSSAFFSLQSLKDNRVLLAHGALTQCSSLLVSLGGAVAEGNKEEGMELVRKWMD